MSYYTASLSVINSLIQKLGSDKITKKDIDNAYPFGERRYYPYKAWLKARKEKMNQLGLTKSSDDKLGNLFEEKQR